jgi:hypothetical protein
MEVDARPPQSRHPYTTESWWTLHACSWRSLRDQGSLCECWDRIGKAFLRRALCLVRHALTHTPLQTSSLRALVFQNAAVVARPAVLATVPDARRWFSADAGGVVAMEVPSMGDSISEGTLISWSKSEFHPQAMVSRIAQRCEVVQALATGLTATR